MSFKWTNSHVSYFGIILKLASWRSGHCKLFKSSGNEMLILEILFFVSASDFNGLPR